MKWELSRGFVIGALVALGSSCTTTHPEPTPSAGPMSAPLADTAVRDSTCPAIDCDLSCANGLAMDESGCAMCACAAPDPDDPCSSLDEDACNANPACEFDSACECNGEDCPPCSPPACVSRSITSSCPVVACDLDCLYGLEQDQAGCYVCACREDESGDCLGDGEVCGGEAECCSGYCGLEQDGTQRCSLPTDAGEDHVH
jgi:hypothetical protein